MNSCLTVELWKPVDSPVCLYLYFPTFCLFVRYSEVWCSRISKRFLLLRRIFTFIISPLLFHVIMPVSLTVTHSSILWDFLLWYQAPFSSSEFFSFFLSLPKWLLPHSIVLHRAVWQNSFYHSTGMANIFSRASPQGFTIYVYVLKQNLTESC